jgi:hypothetical protein
VAPAAPSAPSSPPAAPAEPTAPLAEVIIGLGGIVGVTVGDQCTGITIADTTLGCASTPSDEPAEISPGGSLLAPLGL